jgi:hypothetical protein
MDKILAVKGILELFGQVSKLRVNFKKSTATLIHCENEEATPIVEHLGCPIVELPISYLVIPLTIYSPWLTRWSACYPLQVTAHTKVKQIGSRQIRAWGYTHPSTTRSTSKEDYQSHGENQEVFMWEGRKATKGCCHVRLMQSYEGVLPCEAHAKVKQIGSRQIRAWGYTHPSTTSSTIKEDYQSHGENQEVFMWEGRKATKGGCHVNNFLTNFTQRP